MTDSKFTIDPDLVPMTKTERLERLYRLVPPERKQDFDKKNTISIVNHCDFDVLVEVLSTKFTLDAHAETRVMIDPSHGHDR